MKRRESIKDFKRRSHYYIETRTKQMAYSIVGSCDYMAYGNALPIIFLGCLNKFFCVELIMGNGYDFSVDWWSVGTILFEV